MKQQECRAVPAWDADLAQMRQTARSFEARKYVPPVWARNGHLHTIVASGDLEKRVLGNRTVSRLVATSFGTCGVQEYSRTNRRIFQASAENTTTSEDFLDHTT